MFSIDSSMSKIILLSNFIILDLNKGLYSMPLYRNNIDR